LINAYTSGSSNIVAGYPRALKVLAVDSGFPSGMLNAMRDYKARVPGGKVVVRVYSPKTYTLTNDATTSAGDYWTNVLQQSLNTISSSDRALIDYLEGPNEGDTPSLGLPWSAPLQGSQWFNQFWTNLTPRVVAAGLKPCIGSIPVGNPSGSTAEMQSYLAAFVPALRQAKAAGGAWSYHAYTINYSTDPNVEIYYSLRYRQFYSYFASAYTDLTNMTMILTEGGVDFAGDPSTSGWQARGSSANYERWLNWFDQQMQQDPYVLACTLFENGDPAGWSSFDLEPIGGWMKNYLLPPSNVPAAPTGLVANTGSGAVVLSWTNAPLNPTTWSVKRSTNNGGPYFTIASNLTTGVQASTYTDTTTSNSTTYYCVVTAVNAFGESHNSAQVVATPVGLSSSAINCSGGAVGAFQADNLFSGGQTFSTGTAVATNGVVSPAPMPVYQTQRYGDLTYTVQYLLQNASYKVRLHFAEVYWSGSGQRVFNVLINGTQVLTNYDIFAVAGGNFKAVVTEFNALSDSSGNISIQLVTVVNNAAINGIEIVANPTNAIPSASSNVAAAVGNALVMVSWWPPAGATAFSVKRSTSPGGPYSVIASNLTGTSYRDPSFNPGTTYYYVISAWNALGESANSAQVSATPANGLPDVVVTSVSWSPSNLFAGTNVVFKATVLNRGSAATPSGVTLGVGFNVDGAGTASWSSGYSSALAPNESVTLTADGGPGGVNYWTATTGVHFVTATVDDINRFPESIEDNNSAVANFTVLTTRYAFNSGGGAVGSFAVDSKYAGSANTYSVTNSIDLAGLTNAAPAAVYQTERWGDFAYVLDGLSPGSNYTVRLHFAEISPSVSNVGDRRFNVSLNGLQVFTNFDIFANAGAKLRALTREIKKRADSAGIITVQFTRGASNEPKCSGIEVFASAASPAPQIISLVATNGSAILTWQSAASTLYQAQYLDNLKQTNWTTFSGLLFGTGGPLSVTNSISGASQRFYRIVSPL